VLRLLSVEHRQQAERANCLANGHWKASSLRERVGEGVADH